MGSGVAVDDLCTCYQKKSVLPIQCNLTNNSLVQFRSLRASACLLMAIDNLNSFVMVILALQEPMIFRVQTQPLQYLLEFSTDLPFYLLQHQKTLIPTRSWTIMNDSNNSLSSSSSKQQIHRLSDALYQTSLNQTV